MLDKNASLCLTLFFSDQFHIYCAGPLLALLNFKTDPLAFGQRLPASSLDCAEVDEYVAPLIIFNKPKPLLVIEPFHFSLCQSRTLLFLFH